MWRPAQPQDWITAERFVACPVWNAGDSDVRTGDVVRWRVEWRPGIRWPYRPAGEDSRFRVELGEIESALLNHAGVREAIVVAREIRQAKNN